MLNIIWVVLLVSGIIIGAFTGNIQAVTDAIMSYADTGVELALGLIGMMSLWLGIMKIAEKSGFVNCEKCYANWYRWLWDKRSAAPHVRFRR